MRKQSALRRRIGGNKTVGPCRGSACTGTGAALFRVSEQPRKAITDCAVPRNGELGFANDRGCVSDHEHGDAETFATLSLPG